MRPQGRQADVRKAAKAKKDCIFDAEKIYLINEDTGVLAGNVGWPAEVLSSRPDEPALERL